MSDRAIGSVYSGFIGKVVNVHDPLQNGKVQVRIFGMHDDERLIPDKDLPWAQVIQPPWSAGFNKTGWSPVGLIKGSTVEGRFLDPKRKMIPMVTGVIAKAGDPDKDTAETSGKTKLKEGTNATPPSSRQKDNKVHTRTKVDVKKEDEKPTEVNDSDAVDVVKDVVAKAKFAAMGTIGSLEKAAGSVLSQLKQVDPQSLTTALKNLQSLDSLNQTTQMVSDKGVEDVVTVALYLWVSRILGMMALPDFLTAISGTIETQFDSLTPIGQSSIRTVLESLDVGDGYGIPLLEQTLLDVAVDGDAMIIYDLWTHLIDFEPTLRGLEQYVRDRLAARRQHRRQ